MLVFWRRTHDGAANEIDKAKRSFEDLTMKNSDADVIHNNLDDNDLDDFLL